MHGRTDGRSDGRTDRRRDERTDGLLAIRSNKGVTVPLQRKLPLRATLPLLIFLVPYRAAAPSLQINMELNINKTSGAEGTADQLMLLPLFEIGERTNTYTPANVDVSTQV